MKPLDDVKIIAGKQLRKRWRVTINCLEHNEKLLLPNFIKLRSLKHGRDDVCSNGVNARGSARKNFFLIHAWELECLKRGKYAVTDLETVRKNKDGSNRVNALGYARKDSYVLHEE